MPTAMALHSLVVLFCSLTSSPILPVALILTLNLPTTLSRASLICCTTKSPSNQTSLRCCVRRSPQRTSSSHRNLSQRLTFMLTNNYSSSVLHVGLKKLASGAKTVVRKQHYSLVSSHRLSTSVCAARKARKVAGCATSEEFPSYIWKIYGCMPSQIRRIDCVNLRR
ncbi:uncharacterized protein EI90DRAFT_1203400 [Cantharellus anzutake]|uniref:uncharacterized protein n=1 Tax=Cantharellus anzutake TaxID=1750568 RepID=UPI0019063A65|nr:uncharacterized protein EI90DRAFT_1203400 [Cantharellus anzutake]KAF8310517.1 hypothetical protein EI90DRAFT_1203400 [Cantharellus anzutake]